jgi:C4-dicarboxylate-specific signal transduction histidine kinase
MTALNICSQEELKSSFVGVANEAEVLDRTDRKQAQREIRDTQRQLDDMTHVMAMEEFAASIAHEINQPLAAIITTGAATLRRLAQPTLDAETIRRLTKNMVADAWRASKIVEQIRATVSGRKRQVVCLSLENVVAESIAFLKDEFQSKSISVSLDLAKELPHIVGDRTQLQQVIVNLTVNAVQATAKSDDRIILVRTMLSGPDTVCCVIEDSGAGVDSAHLPHLFDSFFTTKRTGMGMGLSISRSIIEAHGGQIRVDNGSRLGGARFSFELPTNGAGRLPGQHGGRENLSKVGVAKSIRFEADQREDVSSGRLTKTSTCLNIARQSSKDTEHRPCDISRNRRCAHLIEARPSLVHS